MEITQRALEQFIVLAEELHVGRAAERLSMSQPPLSQALARLERAVGVQLFHRTPRGLELTAAGASFLDDTRNIIASRDAAVSRAKRVAQGETGEVHLGFVTGMGYRVVPRALEQLTQIAPSVTIHLSQAPTLTLIERVRSRIVDLALIRTSTGDTTGLDIRELTRERIALAVPTRHRLADHESVELSEAAGDRWVLPDELNMGSLAQHALAICREAGFHPNHFDKADTLTGLMLLVATTGAVSLVPESVAAQPPPGVAIKPLADHAERFDLVTSTMTRAGNSHDRVLELLKRCLTEAVR